MGQAAMLVTVLHCVSLARALGEGHRDDISPHDEQHASWVRSFAGTQFLFQSNAACPPVEASELGSTTRQRNDRPVVFLHLHKAGGTTICDLAKQNGETLDEVQPHENCAIKGDGNWLDKNGIYAGYSRSCAARAEEARTHSFMAIERWMDAEMCDDLAQYAVVLRDPIDRLISNTLFEQKVMHWATDTASILEMIAPNASVHLSGDRADHPSEMISQGTAAYDNFLVRTLAGPEAFALPAGQLTRAHLDEAKRRLARFDVVMVLERLDEQGPAQLSHFLGWDRLELPRSMAGGGADAAQPFSDEQLAVLKRANAFDAELYCYGQKLAEARTADALASRTSQSHAARAGHASGSRTLLAS